MDKTFLAITTVLNGMFFVSGVDKMFHFDKVVVGLQKRLNNIEQLPLLLFRSLIVAAILIEIVCPMIIFYSSLKRNKQNDKLGFYSSIMLIIFTVLATLFYHFPPTTSAKYYPFMSNLSLVGGLSLRSYVFYRNGLL